MNTNVSLRNDTSLKKHIVTMRGALSRFCRVYRPMTIPQNSTATMPDRFADSAMVYAKYGKRSTSAESTTQPSSQSPVIEMCLCSIAEHAPTIPPISSDAMNTPKNATSVVTASSENATSAATVALSVDVTSPSVELISPSALSAIAPAADWCLPSIAEVIPFFAYPLLSNAKSASNNTMEMASFSNDSPSTTACRSGSRPMSAKMLSVVTGSVLLMSDANSIASRSVNGNENPYEPMRYMMNPTTRVDVNVPRNANTEMASKFLNSVSGFRVYPDSKITGGSNTRKKNSVSNMIHSTKLVMRCDCCVLSWYIGSLRTYDTTKPTITPSRSAAPLWCSHWML
mmetsp:Transcript_8647/g.36206  ORF Transcript_8647/g.36206 Transcript_8647/m.36206 type:complete len:342 (+) Transcript_8647:604-1629(+)